MTQSTVRPAPREAAIALVGAGVLLRAFER
jgi:hypothetical protein